MRHLIPLVIISVALAGCGSGGGGAGSSGSPTSSADTRGVPGGSVSVATIADTKLRITTDLVGVAALEALDGEDYLSAVPLPVTADGTGAWTVQPGDAGSLLIRLRLSDGSVIETGRDDFRLR